MTAPPEQELPTEGSEAEGGGTNRYAIEDTGLVASFKASVARQMESGQSGGFQWWLNYTLGYLIIWTLWETLPVWSLLLAWALGAGALMMAWHAISPEGAAMPAWAGMVITVAAAAAVVYFRRPIIARSERVFDFCQPAVIKIMELVVGLMWLAFYIFLIWLFATKVLFAG